LECSSAFAGVSGRTVEKIKEVVEAAGADGRTTIRYIAPAVSYRAGRISGACGA